MNNLILYIAIMISLFLLAFITIDLIPMFSRYLSRMKIGRWNNENKWLSAVTSKAGKWINNIPTTKVSDNEKYILVDILKKRYKKTCIQDWQYAGLILGLSEYKEKYKSEGFEEDIKNLIKRRFYRDGKIKDDYLEVVDAVILVYSAMKANSINNEMTKQLFNKTAEFLKGVIGEDGTVPYRKNLNKLRFVDTIGFISPFCMMYGLLNKDDFFCDLSIKQIREFEKHGICSSSQLPFHVYDTQTKNKLGISGWGRGVGWYLLGIIDTFSIMPQNHPEYLFLKSLVLKYAKIIISFQKENGGWGCVLTIENSQYDASTTSIFSWFLSKALSIDEIKMMCEISLDKALKILMKNTRRNGIVDFSQGDTKGIGVYSNSYDLMPFTQGMTIRFASNYLKD